MGINPTPNPMPQGLPGNAECAVAGEPVTSDEHSALEVGRRLQAVLEDCGLASAAELAEMIGTTEAAVLDWLTGRSKPPPLLANRLANRTGITLVWLYFGDESDMLPGPLARLRRLLASMAAEP